MDVFKDYAEFYDALYKDKDYMSEATDVSNLLKKWGNDIHRIIIYGCGTGKHDRCLKSLGYDIHGIDLSEQMVKEAIDADSEIEYEVADIREYVPSKKYDAVVSLFHVMSYQNTNEDIKKAFASARKALDKGGIFLFDVWNGPGVLTDPPVLRVKKAETEKYDIIRIARPEMHANTNIVDVNYEMLVTDKETRITNVINESHHMRYFFRPEIEDFLAECGFIILDSVSCNELKDPNFDSWTVYYGAKAV